MRAPSPPKHELLARDLMVSALRTARRGIVSLRPTIRRGFQRRARVLYCASTFFTDKAEKGRPFVIKWP